MKKLKIIFILILAGSLQAMAQDDMPPPPPGDRMKKEQKIKALYVAFITESLKFTEEEAQQFWPIHAQFEADFRKLDKQLPELERQQAVLNIKKKYQDKFVKLLGGSRTDEFFRKDAEFRNNLIERLQQRREERGMRPPRSGGRPGRPGMDNTRRGAGPLN